MTEDLINRISYYLSSGGLFNPELADHIAVRNLLMECREALVERTWVGLTDEEKKEFIWMFDETKHKIFLHFKYMEAIEAKLKEKNT